MRGRTARQCSRRHIVPYAQVRPLSRNNAIVSLDIIIQTYCHASRRPLPVYARLADYRRQNAVISRAGQQRALTAVSDRRRFLRQCLSAGLEVDPGTARPFAFAALRHGAAAAIRAEKGQLESGFDRLEAALDTL